MNEQMFDLYLSNPVLSLFEGDGDGDGDGGGDGDGDGGGAGAGGAGGVTLDPAAPFDAGNSDARFDQEAVNKIIQDRLSKERKRNQEKYQSLEKSYQDLLGNAKLSEEERSALEQQLEDLRKQHRTKEEQAKHEKKQLQETHQNELKEWKERAVKWEGEYKTFVVEKSLMEAAVSHDAFLPSQIQDVLIKYTKLVDEKDESNQATGRLIPMVDLPDRDAETGKQFISQRSPMEAVERLKELQPNLFKSNVVSGVGGNSTTGGVQPGKDGKVNASELTTEQFMKLYKEDPTKLGLGSRRRY